MGSCLRKQESLSSKLSGQLNEYASTAGDNNIKAPLVKQLKIDTNLQEIDKQNKILIDQKMQLEKIMDQNGVV